MSRSANEKKMFELLLDEIEDTLQDIEQRALKLESSDQSKELQIIFRAAHNVKGAAQLYGLNEFASCVHGFEDLLTTLQKLQKPVTAQTVDLILNAQSFLRNWLQGLREQEKFLPDTQAIKESLKIHIEDLKAGRVIEDPINETKAPSAKVAVAPTPKVDAPPALKVVSNSDVASAPGAMPAQVPAESPAPASTAEVATPGSGARNRRTNATLRIPSMKIDEIMQLIGELSIHQGILWHNYQSNTFNLLNCKNAVVLNQKTLKDLYDLILTLRMQPAETLFQRIERTARDIAREQKKRLNIQLAGAETPLDKTVIELITDPMMHLVRNAIDHGIEDEETRVSLGKPPIAKLSIQTHQDSGHVVISISDDGRGLDTQMILEKAIRRGIVPPNTKLKEEDIIQLIFLPGFSTRETVTSISGRGVGMDIVQKAIQGLGGRIETTSKKGVGTTFQISLPASLEIIEGLLVRVTDQLYIAPRQDVIEIIDLGAYDIEKVGYDGRAIRMRDKLIPVEDLADYIGLKAARADERETHKNASAATAGTMDLNQTGAHAVGRDIALLIRLADRSQLALRVDAVLAQQQIVVRPLSDQLSLVPGFSGVTILGNGEPAMILSCSGVGEMYLKWIQRKAPRDPSKTGKSGTDKETA